MKKKRVTISDIAKEAGVSKATVSRVINNSFKVRPELKEKIREIMHNRSYYPSQIAQSLAGSPTRTVGIIIDELANLFYIEIAEGFDQVISQKGISMQISSSKWDELREVELVRDLIHSQVDGVVLAPVSERSKSIGILKESGIPFVLVNVIPPEEGIAYVSCDNFLGGKMAADFANKINRRCILITGFPHQTLAHRVKGFQSNFHHKMGLTHYEGINTYEQGYELPPLLEIRSRISEVKTTLFVANDNVAIGVLNRLKDMRIEVPQQVAVIGYDDIRASSFCRIPLTTISQSSRDIGRIAALELEEMIKNPDKPKPKYIIEPQLIVRHSASLD